MARFNGLKTQTGERNNGAGGALVALSVLLAALALVFASIGRRPPRSRRSIDRYHKAMETLGEISETLHRTEINGPAKSSTGSSRAPESTDGREHLASAPATRRRAQHDVRSRRSFRFVVAIAVVALAGIVVGATLSSSGNSKHVAAARTGRGLSTRRSSTATSAAQTTAPARPNTTAATSPASSSEGPVLTSLEPDSGAAGETLILSGRGITSANGTIVATFDSRPAPTRCPSEQRCLVTVPAGLKGSVAVRLQTESGSSNALTFHHE
jgi:IPT/TIG domain